MADLALLDTDEDIAAADGASPSLDGLCTTATAAAI
jgi:hypothetical protein